MPNAQAPPALLLKKETLAQVFSIEFCEISKNTFSYRTLSVVASVGSKDFVESRKCCPIFTSKNKILIFVNYTRLKIAI